jgi:hypothetical protein
MSSNNYPTLLPEFLSDKIFETFVPFTENFFLKPILDFVVCPISKLLTQYILLIM